MVYRDFYHSTPQQLQPGDELAVVIKAVVTRIEDGIIYYRLYRCKYDHPWDSPQGGRVFFNEELIAKSVLPILSTGQVDP